MSAASLVTQVMAAAVLAMLPLLCHETGYGALHTADVAQRSLFDGSTPDRRTT